MAKVKLSEAAALTGKSISTLHRRVKDGSITVTKNINGEYTVDIAELQRFYGDLSLSDDKQTPLSLSAVSNHDDNALKEQIVLLKDQIDYLKLQLTESTQRETRLMNILESRLLPAPVIKQAEPEAQQVKKVKSKKKKKKK